MTRRLRGIGAAGVLFCILVSGPSAHAQGSSGPPSGSPQSLSPAQDQQTIMDLVGKLKGQTTCPLITDEDIQAFESDALWAERGQNNRRPGASSGQCEQKLADLNRTIVQLYQNHDRSRFPDNLRELPPAFGDALPTHGGPGGANPNGRAPLERMNQNLVDVTKALDALQNENCDGKLNTRILGAAGLLSLFNPQVAYMIGPLGSSALRAFQAFKGLFSKHKFSLAEKINLCQANTTLKQSRSLACQQLARNVPFHMPDLEGKSGRAWTIQGLLDDSDQATQRDMAGNFAFQALKALDGIKRKAGELAKRDEKGKPVNDQDSNLIRGVKTDLQSLFVALRCDWRLPENCSQSHPGFDCDNGDFKKRCKEIEKYRGQLDGPAFEEDYEDEEKAQTTRMKTLDPFHEAASKEGKLFDKIRDSLEEDYNAERRFMAQPAPSPPGSQRKTAIVRPLSTATGQPTTSVYNAWLQFNHAQEIAEARASFSGGGNYQALAKEALTLLPPGMVKRDSECKLSCLWAKGADQEFDNTTVPRGALSRKSTPEGYSPFNIQIPQPDNGENLSKVVGGLSGNNTDFVKFAQYCEGKFGRDSNYACPLTCQNLIGTIGTVSRPASQEPAPTAPAQSGGAPEAPRSQNENTPAGSVSPVK